MRLFGVAPVSPTSASRASPGPFTIQPITATSMGVKNLMATETYPNTARLLQQELGDNFTSIPMKF